MSDTNKEYGLVWDREREPEKVVIDCQSNIPVLKQVPKREIDSGNGEDNILIEGDNYHALSVLNYTHKGKIDVIYIDPPYNTGGSKEWKYNDKYVDKEDVYRHSKWLNFMEKRLRLAKNLLKEEGVIFISIDDNELFQLKLLCDKIFGENNFIVNFCWHNNVKGRQMDQYIKNTYESILVYSKKIDLVNVNTEIEKVNVEKLNKDSISYFKKDYPLHNGTSDFHINNRPNLAYTIYYNPETETAQTLDEKNKDNNIFTIGGVSENGRRLLNKGYFRILPKYNENYKNQRVWRWGEKKFLLEYKTELIFEKEESGYYIYQKKRFKNGYHEKKPKNYINIDSGSDKSYLAGLFNNASVFTNPKPVSLMKKIIKISSNKNATILDFFAGSGTTGHAVLKLNQEDGGNRRFILCTNNENNICKEVTYPRIKKVIEGYQFTKNNKTILYEKKLTLTLLKETQKILDKVDNVKQENESKYDKIETKFDDGIIRVFGINNAQSFQQGLGGNLHYYKTALIPVEQNGATDRKRHELTEQAGQMIAMKEHTLVLEEINDWYQIFRNRNGSKKTAIYFREDKSKFNELINKIGTVTTKLYIFSYEREINSPEYMLAGNFELAGIPEPILEIYKQINKLFKKK